MASVHIHSQPKGLTRLYANALKLYRAVYVLFNWIEGFLCKETLTQGSPYKMKLMLC
ncbi:hypothetical protein DICPUDRAFT_146797 [Dictyostelium purpureum]|uniref:Uncharacterized protein n=1 Tax=Dictyostelium purpureum TaxID=5786 RepID=F0Z6X2_DICPU|nr:uncharacterized protein DICPUDRAFT_146797 [Dictyostelium purpureum]XP_003284808.1 uncharacterized protein DICPUDRAFT_148627 [Dictyostelium purpureum]XP_003290915.1 uncharacterized protein DICPUDRAFT_155448 [Dictyostelium purpureum]XP_003291554.1 uncharacterized protein DICPUDRAFT_156170 [Dictyostelium purpureum]XP_003292050.1 uncharacterized protein DICPUDRAFT_156741 [Dictyostelium purpureum]XP_003293994.1 uncharacterized protein DICPUDRAFT_158921 [Dictyostelium purpureum]EGC29485.1 hypoth|eukprot:XP_003283164.1 hypothetical protein DICPUDRAFT_146797 [Dictyostelium purpureum]